MRIVSPCIVPIVRKPSIVLYYTSQQISQHTIFQNAPEFSHLRTYTRLWRHYHWEKATPSQVICGLVASITTSTTLTLTSHVHDAFTRDVKTVLNQTKHILARGLTKFECEIQRKTFVLAIHTRAVMRRHLTSIYHSPQSCQ